MKKIFFTLSALVVMTVPLFSFAASLPASVGGACIPVRYAKSGDSAADMVAVKVMASSNRNRNTKSVCLSDDATTIITPVLNTRRGTTKVKFVTAVTSTTDTTGATSDELSVSGPASLDVKETGTWTVAGSGSTGSDSGKLRYRVSWKDTASPSAGSYSSWKKTGTFTHKFTRANSAAKVSFQMKTDGKSSIKTKMVTICIGSTCTAGDLSDTTTTSGDDSTVVTGDSAGDCHIITGGVLRAGMSDGDTSSQIANLQTFLVDRGFLKQSNLDREGLGKYTSSYTKYAVTAFQNWYKLSATGEVNTETADKINLLNCGLVSNQTAIDSITGPTSLLKGASGSWTVAATAAESKPRLSYAVDWAVDTRGNPTTAAKSTSTLTWYSSPNFTRAYTKVGTYNVIFYAATSKDDIASEAYPVCVGTNCATDTEEGDIVVTAPTAGTTWTAGTSQTITWTDAGAGSTEPSYEVFLMAGTQSYGLIGSTTANVKTLVWPNVGSTTASVVSNYSGTYTIKVCTKISAADTTKRCAESGNLTLAAGQQSGSGLDFVASSIPANLMKDGTTTISWTDSAVADANRVYSVKLLNLAGEIRDTLGATTSKSYYWANTGKKSDGTYLVAGSYKFMVCAVATGSAPQRCSEASQAFVYNDAAGPDSAFVVSTPAAGATLTTDSSNFVINWTDPQKPSTPTDYYVTAWQGNTYKGLIWKAYITSETGSHTWAKVGQLSDGVTYLTPGSYTIRVSTTSQATGRYGQSGSFTISGTHTGMNPMGQLASIEEALRSLLKLLK